MSARNKPNEIRITRVYDAPVSAVWSAFTDPAEAAHWWGPRGFTLTTHSKDLRAGGTWHYTMHGPDGVDYPNIAVYHVVEERRKLVYDHGATEDRPPLFRVTALFSESQGKTTLDMTMALATAEEAAATRKFIKQAGGNSTWDRLAEYLDETGKDRTCFVINRSFDVPIEAVFDRWVDPKHLVRWQPPVGFEMTILRGGIRAGGDLFFRMSNGKGVTFHACFDYREIDRPRRIVYVQRFCDERENEMRFPGMPEFPAVLQTTVTFVPEGEDATRVTVRSDVHDEISGREMTAFRNERAGMTQGWNGSFDQLESMLESR